MKARVRRSALLAVVVAIALITSGCWRVGNLDGPGTGSLEGRTGDSVNVDKSVVVVPVGVYQVPVITYADPISHRLRVGVDRVGTGWHFDDLDGPGTGSVNGRTGNDVGTFNSAALGVGAAGPGRSIDVYYFDSTSSRLRHGHFNGGPDAATAWNFDDVDGPGTTLAGHTEDLAGKFNAASFYAGHPDDLYLAVAQKQLKPTGRLRHTWFDGTSHFEDVDGIGGVCVGQTDHDVGSYTAAQPDGVALHAFYYDATAHTLRHARWNGSTWTCETLDGAGGGGGRVTDDVGQYISTTMTPDGHLHVFYLDATTHRLRHGNFDGSTSTWTFENLDGPGVAGGAGRTAHMVGSSTAAAPNAPGSVIDVLYSDDTAHSLRHGRFDGSTWTFETIDGTGSLTVGRTSDQVGQYNAIAYGGTPIELQMWTGDLTSGNLRSGCSFGPGIPPPAACS